MTPTPSFDELVARTAGPQPWRRVFHAANGVAIVAILLLLNPSWEVAVGILGGIVLALLALDGLRFTIPAMNRLFFRLLRPFASPREARGVASSTWFMVGVLLAVAVFPREIAVPAILVLALADPLASALGRRFGKRRLGSGTVLGTVVFFGVAFFVLTPFAGLPAALIAALGAALLEPLPWRLDDNLVVPLVTGVILWSLLPLPV